MSIHFHKRRPDSPPDRLHKRLHRTRWIIVSIVLLIIVAGASIWILTNRNILATILPLVIFTVLGVLIALFQWLFPLSLTASEYVPTLSHASSIGPDAPVIHQEQAGVEDDEERFPMRAQSHQTVR